MSFSEAVDIVAGWGAHLSASKAWFESVLPFHDDAMHVMIGVLLQLIGAFVLRSSLARWRPWIFAAVLELLNEANDLLWQGWPETAHYGPSIIDFILTMALPTVLLIVARVRPGLMSGR